MLDIRDAASALVALLNTPLELWKSTYNVGWNNKTYTLVELADTVVRIAQKHGAGEVRIRLEPEDIRTYGGMNSSLFTADTGWLPQYGIDDIIERCVAEYLRRAEETKMGGDNK